jgi:hypothetical protein
MRNTIAILALSLAAVTCHADNIYLLTASISATVAIQGVETNNGTTTTTPTPAKYSLVTSGLLKMIAISEFNAGSWPSNSFPKNATLVFHDDKADFSSSWFTVNLNGVTLLDVDNVLFATPYDKNYVYWGKYADATGLSTSGLSQQFLAYFTYNDVGLGGATSFSFGGLISASNKDTTKIGHYVETEKDELSNGAGIGTIGGKNVILTGGFTLSGTNSFPL